MEQSIDPGILTLAFDIITESLDCLAETIDNTMDDRPARGKAKIRIIKRANKLTIIKSVTDETGKNVGSMTLHEFEKEFGAHGKIKVDSPWNLYGIGTKVALGNLGRDIKIIVIPVDFPNTLCTVNLPNYKEDTIKGRMRKNPMHTETAPPGSKPGIRYEITELTEQTKKQAVPTIRNYIGTTYAFAIESDELEVSVDSNENNLTQVQAEKIHYLRPPTLIDKDIPGFGKVTGEFGELDPEYEDGIGTGVRWYDYPTGRVVRKNEKFSPELDEVDTSKLIGRVQCDWHIHRDARKKAFKDVDGYSQVRGEIANIILPTLKSHKKKARAPVEQEVLDKIRDAVLKATRPYDDTYGARTKVVKIIKKVIGKVRKTRSDKGQERGPLTLKSPSDPNDTGSKLFGPNLEIVLDEWSAPDVYRIDEMPNNKRIIYINQKGMYDTTLDKRSRQTKGSMMWIAFQATHAILSQDGISGRELANEASRRLGPYLEDIN